ncbi:MAG TPA: hypothetical protein VD902_03560 [Symbiobacteriaceae bacterium]|nr:hypothetical protein [Symbiobacteriaceae bacterium]
MWFGFFPFPIFGLFFLLFVGFMLFRGRRHGRWCPGGPEAEGILKRRLAGGEIGEEEYQRLKEVLSK